jgi:hypothetical protein
MTLKIEAVKIEQPNVLVVEGREEELFFGALIKHLGLRNIQTIPIGGKGQLRPKLKALAASPRFSEVISLGIVRDANADPDAAFQSVRDALQTVGLPAPDRPLMFCRCEASCWRSDPARTGHARDVRRPLPQSRCTRPSHALREAVL